MTNLYLLVIYYNNTNAYIYSLAGMPQTGAVEPFKPQIDEEGDIFIRYQMKTFYVMNANSDDEDYLIVVYPQMYEIDEGEETIVLAACNKMTREIKLAKLYIDQTLKNVSASCEFYYNGEESLKTCLDKAIEILGMVRPAFVKTIRSFD